MEPPAIESYTGGVLLRVRVQPKASRNAVVEACPAFYRVALSAPPVDGEANKALVEFLAKTLGVKKRQISIQSGAQSRLKTLQIESAGIEAIQTSFASLLG